MYDLSLPADARERSPRVAARRYAIRTCCFTGSFRHAPLRRHLVGLLTLEAIGVFINARAPSAGRREGAAQVPDVGRVDEGKVVHRWRPTGRAYLPYACVS